MELRCDETKWIFFFFFFLLVGEVVTAVGAAVEKEKDVGTSEVAAVQWFSFERQ